ncbi:MAG: tetratricopeptide repeat protein [Anaerolineae bacterium]|nr:tetratricopeptide repeat protein [Anaerolineae bacterium]
MVKLFHHAGGATKSSLCWLLPGLALLLFMGQAPLVSLVQRQVGLRTFLGATYASEAVPVEERSAELTAAQVEAFQAAAWQLQQAGDQVDTDRVLGRVALAANRLGEAEQHLLRRLTAAPGDEIARYFLGETYLRQGKTPAAIAQWAIARDSERLITLAQELKPEQPTQALEALEAVMAFDPTNLSARQVMADLWLKQGNSEQALALSREIITIAPEKPSGYALTGSILFREKRFEEAIASLQQALQRSETGPQWVLSLLGQSYAGLGRWTEAAEAYDRAIRADPAKPGPYALMGEAQCQLGHPAEARLVYEQAIKLGDQSNKVRQTLEYITQHGDCPDSSSEKK